MAKFMIRAGYTAEGIKGLIKDKPAGRVAAVKKAVSGLGGKLEGFYWALGDDDVILIVDMDVESVAALTMAVAASGMARSSTTRLLTDKEVDAAIGKNVRYRPPGKGK